jgi:hypothetical protein
MAGVAYLLTGEPVSALVMGLAIGRVLVVRAEYVREGVRDGSSGEPETRRGASSFGF